MGLLDNLRDRISGGFGDDYDDDDYYDDYDDEDYDDEPTGTGLLGNTPRPEAESVAVYTRSGRPVTSEPAGQSTSQSSRRASARQTTSTTSRRSQQRDRYDGGYDDYDSTSASSVSRQPAAPSFNASGQLPPYVLRAEEYEDVQTVVRRVRTNQPVFLVLETTPADIAQRILDFCFGLAFGIGGEVQPVTAKAFLVLPEGIEVSDSEIDRLLGEVR